MHPHINASSIVVGRGWGGLPVGVPPSMREEVGPGRQPVMGGAPCGLQVQLSKRDSTTGARARAGAGANKGTAALLLL